MLVSYVAGECERSHFFLDRSGIDLTWIASGGGLSLVQDRSTLFRAK